MRLTLADIRDAMGAVGDLHEADGLEVTRVRTDSRLVERGDLFVCLPGSRFDGHLFATEAARRGAGAILSQRHLPEVTETPVLLVTDTLEALGRLAAFWRGRFQARGGRVVAVTGSAGKTTVKEMLANILERRWRVVRNYKNYNNLLGAPLTMLGAAGDEDIWVLEVGISQPGEMATLAAMVGPDVAVIHNVGPAHLEGLGSLRGVAQEKCQLLRALRPEGQALVSRDYPELLAAAADVRPVFTTLSTRDDTAFAVCQYVGSEAPGQGRFALTIDGHALDVTIAQAGSHWAENLAAAAGAAHLLGAGLEDIRAGLAEPLAMEQRFRCCPCGQFLVIDDSYNANPLSMIRAAASAREMAGEGALYLVLGDMRELGHEARERHVRLGEELAALAPTAIFFRGSHGPDVQAGLGAAGYAGRFASVDSPRQFLDCWGEWVKVPGVVLVKGSRSLRMEEFAQALLALYRCPEGKA